MIFSIIEFYVPVYSWAFSEYPISNLLECLFHKNCLYDRIRNPFSRVSFKPSKMNEADFTSSNLSSISWTWSKHWFPSSMLITSATRYHYASLGSSTLQSQPFQVFTWHKKSHLPCNQYRCGLHPQCWSGIVEEVKWEPWIAQFDVNAVDI